MESSMQVWTGQYSRTLDQKGRFLLPKACRDRLAQPDLYIAPGTQHCLELHTADSLEAYALRLQRSSLSEKTSRTFVRLFYSQSSPVQLDAQGRIRLPASLIRWAELGSEIYIVGAGNCLEVWNSECWLSFVETNQTDFDQLCERAFSGNAVTTEKNIEVEVTDDCPEQRPSGSFKGNLTTRTPK